MTPSRSLSAKGPGRNHTLSHAGSKIKAKPGCAESTGRSGYFIVKAMVSDPATELWPS